MHSVIFHIAFPVNDLDTAKDFYGNVLGAHLGRENEVSVIMNLYGHQLVAHLSKEELPAPIKSIYPRHYGLIFTRENEYDDLINNLNTRSIEFFQAPRTRFRGQMVEHRTLFIEDPFNNLWEFKYYADPRAIFESMGSKSIGDT